MHKINRPALIVFFLLTTASSLIAANYERQFEKQKALAENRKERDSSKSSKTSYPVGKEQALEVLYAYMPLSDLADYDGDYYLKNARLALLARDTFPWGKNLPEDIFRQFVLPIRVNNENLDGSREVFFAELKERLKGLSIEEEAALEVNHWAHEKVTYRGTDVRTSCPLATVKTAFGRCGEETDFCGGRTSRGGHTSPTGLRPKVGTL